LFILAVIGNTNMKWENRRRSSNVELNIVEITITEQTPVNVLAKSIQSINLQQQKIV